jgi:hypothetical protein
MHRVLHSIPAADGCRLLLSRHRFSDLDTALAFLRLARSDVVRVEATSEVPQVAELGPEFCEDEDDELRTDVSPQDEDLDIDLTRGTAPRNTPPSIDFAGIIAARQSSAAAERSMIAYMLTPDERSNENTEQPAYTYASVTNRIQRVRAKALAPDPESWRVARQVADRGPRVAGRGKIDIRECVFRIARAEGIDYLPRMTTSRHVDSVKILIDADLARGLFAYDVDQLERALRSTCAPSSGRAVRLIRDGRSWLGGSGPVWTFTPLGAAERQTWHILIAGGQAAKQANLQIWGTFLYLFGPRDPISVIWVGDLLRRRHHRRGESWFSFRTA